MQMFPPQIHPFLLYSSVTFVSLTISPEVVYALHGPLTPADYLCGLSELVRFMDGLCSRAAMAHPASPRMQHAILRHYENTSR